MLSALELPGLPPQQRFSDKEGRKPEGKSFHHGKFVTKLCESTAAQPNIILLEATVVKIMRDEQSGNVTGALCSVGDGRLEKVRGNVPSLP